jgi:hypothetical protein
MRKAYLAKIRNMWEMLLLTQDGEKAMVANPSDAKSPLDVLLIAGVPLNEPINSLRSICDEYRSRNYSSLCRLS